MIMILSNWTGRKTKSLKRYLSVGLVGLFIGFLALPVSESHAAKITYVPNGATVSVAKGKMITFPVSVNLIEPDLSSPFVSIGLGYLGGTLNPDWINGKVFLTLNSTFMSRQASIIIMPPEDAVPGHYTAILKPFSVRSNEDVTAEDLVIYIEVTEQVACQQVPLFNNLAASQQDVSVRNKKTVEVELTGSVEVDEGCPLIGDIRYFLDDEYDELDQEFHLRDIGPDGQFSVVVPILASRKGSDKDGREYTIVFEAENDAGVGKSSQTLIRILHDNREK